MIKHIIPGLYYAVATLMLTVLIAQVVFLAAVLLSVAGLSIPLVDKSVGYCGNGCVTSYHGNPYAIIPLSTLPAFLTTYSIHKKQPSKSDKTRLFLYGLVAVIVILVAVFFLAYLGICGLACALIICDNNVQECSVSIGWLYANVTCVCG